MKKNNLLILILLLTIGFASVSTTLMLNGNVNLGFNDTDFNQDIIFTRAVTPYGNAVIEDTKKDITFNTEKLENVGQVSTLEFDVTNKSRNYDADVTIVCGLTEEFASYSEYVTIEKDLASPFKLASSETKTGHITVELKKAFDGALEKDIEFMCTLVATPVEKEELGSEYTPASTYTDAVLKGADPVLKDELIPVTLSSDGTVTYADTRDEWYNYTNKEWANAVILVDAPSKEYQVGNVIKESDIESYFVWIPRYRYQIFDEGNYTTQVSDSKPEESIAHTINIEFENKTMTPSTGSTTGSWLTHPAFTNFDVNGLWVGKFETGYMGANATVEAQVNEIQPEKVVVKPNTYSWRYNVVSNMFKTAYNYKREMDSHMMKNTEWGAAAYLSHSIYGINTEVRINNNSDYLTGYASVTEPTCYSGNSESCNQYGTNSSVTQPYNTTTGYKASTTGNITGIYDMSGGAWEYMAAYMSSENDQSEFTAEEFVANAKYLDVYSNNSTITSYNNRILGDATGEMGPFYYYQEGDGTSYRHNNWYSDNSNFLTSTHPWFGRGGYATDGVRAGQFYVGRGTANAHTGCSSRLVLAPTN